MHDNVFSPAFGNRPIQLVGRDDLLADLLNALDSKPGSKERAVVLLGQRGMGKTVLLWELADRARERGFVVASPTVVAEGMSERIVEKIQDDGERYVRGKRQIVGGTVGALGFTAGLQFSDEVRETKSFGYKLAKLVERLGEQGHGVLLLVDELQASSLELKQLIISYQELVGERQNVAMVLAGLPGAVSAILNEHVLTFLNRALKVTLDPLKISEVDAFYSRAFKESGLRIAPELRRKAAEATQGSPYLLQLIGYNIVAYSAGGGSVQEDVLDDALYAARRSFEDDVCHTTLAALSDKDAAFLRAMAIDAGPSRMSDIAFRMGVTDDYAQKYRKRLISSGVISSPRRGYVAFAVPHLATYLAKDA